MTLTVLSGCSAPMGVLPVSDVAPAATAQPAVEAKRPARTEGPYPVVSVTDGDTIQVAIDGTSTRVRLIGIDTPEVKDPRKPVQCFGAQASQRAHELMDDRNVWLEFDPTQDRTDRYGRLLAYVWVDGSGMVNEAMVRDGFAHEYTYDQPYKYRSVFKSAERSARDRGRGLWSTATCNGDTDQPASVRPTTAPIAVPAMPPAAGTALAAVGGLIVKGRAPKTGYTRDQFGQSWFDTDRNGCDTRNDILRRDLGSRQMKNACKVLAGTLAPDPYTATSIRFVYGGASEVDIDHVVALSDSWQKGAATWPAGKRLAFANDPLNLLAVDASANRSKGDGDTATWLPPNKPYRCTYVARQVAVKGKYGVWVTSAERDAMTRTLAACPAIRLPGPGSASTVAALPRTAQPAPQPAAAPQPGPAPAPSVGATYYANCTAVRAAGAAPIHRGDLGYASKLDRDNDGIGCE